MQWHTTAAAKAKDAWAELFELPGKVSMSVTHKSASHVSGLAGPSTGHPVGRMCSRTNPIANTPAAYESVAGFWLGLWHGLILPFSFLVSLFSDNVNVYEVHNNGGWYNFGFLLGVATLFGGGASAST